MAGVTLQNICKVYPGGVAAVQDFNLDIEDREFIILVGPSGCGKSTTLRMIAGLEEISGGELAIGGRRMNETPPRDRDIAMVFQNYALYPHMTVYDNMAFGLKMRKIPKAEIHRRVEDAARQLEITELLPRKPKALSGGQRQRVALGRAMVRDPAVFLLDEPLSNLDAKLRAAMRAEISRLHQRLGSTFVYVTHDQTEAMTMGDRIVVMKDGFIQQVDSPQALYDHPCNLFVAGFIGSPQMNFLPAALEQREGEFYAVFGENALPIPAKRFSPHVLENAGCRKLILGIRPEDLHSSAAFPGESAPHPVNAVIELVEPMGSEKHLHLSCGGEKLVARVSPREAAQPGDFFRIFFDCVKLHLFDPETGCALPSGI
ncbi:ABC transporter ATP-binding protein [Anaerotruncus rubiinfantis]|uniref:ABC transporter ATP-binding protein n=1 Tax=Anaerotruncus rubiinfantis TaxID=1720200 RepID=UPI00082EFF6F|nr:sn-glycerol-3-phosphate ABC transporter ATP-binding protein UgpC [Anaerotruncus rubiinfantis]